MTLPSIAAMSLLVILPLAVRAQDTVSVPPMRDSSERETSHHTTVGSDDENYLRYLQAAGLAAQYPWSLREFSQAELARLAVKPGSHPWTRSGVYENYPARRSFQILPVNVVFRFNSAFPYGSNDGAVWAGRGLTSAVDLGVAFQVGPLSGTINPIAFRAENTAFSLRSVGPNVNPFGDAVSPRDIDRPQRFGAQAYSRVDPGQSSLRLDLFGLGAGVSTANMGWGPMELFPYLLGANAPGIPHAFMGTAHPLPVLIGKIHGRVVWGRLEQSEYSSVTGTSYYSSQLEPGTKRFMSGLIGVFQPRGLPGLELGAARFFHSVWPRTGIPPSYFTKPFEAILKNSVDVLPGFATANAAGIGENQLASAFFRWVFPASRFELYGEYGREDHNADTRDLLQEPDHSRTYGLGLRKVFRADSLSLSAFQLELINYELPTLARHRGEGSTYLHAVLRQGHTNLGQVLGADAGVGTGGGVRAAWDRYDRRGKITIGWARTIRAQDGAYYLGDGYEPRANSVSHALQLERIRYTRLGRVQASIDLVREFNRNFERDAWNVNSTLGLRHTF